MNQQFSEIHPPNRFILRWFDRLALLLAGLISIASVFLTLWFTPLKDSVLRWTIGSLSILVILLFFRNKPALLPKFIESVVIEEGGCFLLWLWVTILFLDASYSVDIVNLIALYPQYTLPFALLITRTPRIRSLTYSVLLLTLLTAVILGIGSWVSIIRNNALLPVLEVDSVFSIISIILWAIFGSLIMYYLVRRSQLNQMRILAVQNAMVRLLEIDDPIISAGEVGKILKDQVGLGERVLITSYDDSTDTVKVIACAGEKATRLSGYELPKGKGISRRAIKSMKTQHVGNVIKDPDFISGGLPEKGSEICVPIIAFHENVSRVIGTLNIQDNALNAFSNDDINAIEIFAKMIANFGYGYSVYFERLLNLNLEKINRFDDPEKVIHQVVYSAGSLFNSPLVCYYRLAVGTGVPLRPCYLKGDFKSPDFFANPNLFVNKSDLVRWVYDWDIKYIRHMKSDENLLNGNFGFGIDFQEKEEVISMCFLPIGSRDYKVGALLMFFKNQKMFSKSEIINIQGFAREIWPHIARIESMKSFLRGFAKPQIHFHSIMAETGLGRGTWESILRQIESSDEVSPELKEQVKKLHAGIKVFLDRVRAWEVTQIFQLGESDFFSIKGALNKACGDLQQRFGGSVVREIDNRLEMENDDIKQVVYILATEAIRNAFIHGGTAIQIHLKINCSDGYIKIMVSDNGVGFEPQKILSAFNNDPAYRSHGSIFDLDILGRQLLGADPIDWLDTAPGKGTRLLWKIPLLGGNNS